MATTFEQPVSVLVGLGYRVEISTPLEAIRFLLEYPCGCIEKQEALERCKTAIEGQNASDQKASDNARLAFTAFAAKKDILLDTMPVRPAFSEWTVSSHPHRAGLAASRPIHKDEGFSSSPGTNVEGFSA